MLAIRKVSKNLIIEELTHQQPQLGLHLHNSGPTWANKSIINENRGYRSVKGLAFSADLLGPPPYYPPTKPIISIKIAIFMKISITTRILVLFSVQSCSQTGWGVSCSPFVGKIRGAWGINCKKNPINLPNMTLSIESVNYTGNFFLELSAMTSATHVLHR